MRQSNLLLHFLRMVKFEVRSFGVEECDKHIWSSRGLSLYGKVTIIKSFLISKFVYVCSILPTPKVVSELNRLLFKFLSGSQRGVPWSPGALKFLLWSPEPDHFTDWSPDTFLAVEPGAQRNFARSPEPSIFKCLFVCV